MPDHKKYNLNERQITKPEKLTINSMLVCVRRHPGSGQ